MAKVTKLGGGSTPAAPAKPAPKPAPAPAKPAPKPAPPPSKSAPKPAPAPSKPAPQQQKPAPARSGNGRGDPTAALATFSGFAPAMMESQADQVIAPGQGGGGNYIGFATDRASSWEQVQAAGCGDGELYVSYQGELIPCHPMKFVMLDGYNYLAKFDTSYGVLKSTTDMSQKFDRGNWQEAVLSVCLVFLPDGRVAPCRGEFYTTKANIGTGMIAEIRNAMTPEWAAESKAHELAARASVPAMRVTGVASTGSQKISKSSGNPYYPGFVTCTPTTAEDLITLAGLAKDETWMAELEEVRTQVNQRKAQIDRVAE